MSDNVKTIDKTFLMDKVFYFILERNDAYGSIYTGSGFVESPNDKHHVEVAIYRLDETGKKIDVVDGKQVPARILRSWIEMERQDRIFLVRAGKTEKKTDFSSPDMVPFPPQGFQASDMPGLVIVKVPELEDYRGHIAYARVFDGLQWGQWSRIPQTHMEIVDENNQPLGDVRVSRPKPKISGSVAADRVRIERKDIASVIGITCAVEDYVPIKAVYLNGKTIYLKEEKQEIKEGKIDVSKQDGRYRVELKENTQHPVKITDGCQRIEIVAENALGGRSEVVKLYRPIYSESVSDKGKVQGYVTDGADFKMESEVEKPQLFRILFHAIPYRLPPLQGEPEGAGNPGNAAKPLKMKAGVRTGNNKFSSVDLQQREKDQGPYLGADVTVPREIRNLDKTAGNPASKIIVDVRMEQDGTSGFKLSLKEAVIPIDPKSWVWQSELMLLIPGRKQIGSGLPAKLGDLIQTYVNVRWNEVVASIGEQPDAYEKFKDHLRICSRKSAAACVRPVTPSKRQPLGALKNGDVVGIEAYTLAAQPKALAKVKREHDHAEDNNAAAPFELKSSDAAQEIEFTMEDRACKAHLENLGDKGEKDTAQRDETDVPVTNEVEMERVKAEYGPDAKLEEPFKEYENLKSSIDPELRAPGRIKYQLISKQSQTVRLLTQEYLTADMVRDRGKQGEKRHQILPYGYFSIAIRAEKSQSEKPAVEDRYRALEITKRWYLGDKPSIQPALAGTNPRVGGPGTHRVGGLAHKLRDGSVYVHNGELFQAAEDLHIKGKLLDFALQRSHLSHSLFTSDLGRNWDWIGNMRLVELLSGQVLLMNGECQVEIYGASSVRQPLESDAVGWKIKKGRFDYSELFSLSRYQSPAGVYRSLIKSKPVALGDDEDSSVPQSEPARFYLVDKHGTIWTFAQDTRFHQQEDNSSSDIQASDSHEPAPGVFAHWVLISIHDRRQSSSIRLQRDGRGLVCGIIDDYRRVVSMKHVDADAAADRLLREVADFAGRRVAYDKTVRMQAEMTRPAAMKLSNRNLGEVSGPLLEQQFIYEYTTHDTGLRHRLSKVTDPAEAKNKRAFLHVDSWHAAGQVKRQKVMSWFTVPGDLKSVADKLAQVGRFADKEWATVHEFEFKAKLTSHKIHDPISAKKKRKSEHEYDVEVKEGSSFAEVVRHRVKVGHHNDLKKGFSGKAETAMKFDSQGELIELTLPGPAKQTTYWKYEESGSQQGNLLKVHQQGDKGPVASEETYPEYDKKFNFPKKHCVLSYMSPEQPEKSNQITTEQAYFSDGSVEKVIHQEVKTGEKPPEQDEASKNREELLSYLKDGRVESSTSLRGVTTKHLYYSGEEHRAPGDAHDAFEMPAMTIVAPGKNVPSEAELRKEKWSSLRTWGRERSREALAALRQLQKDLRDGKTLDESQWPMQYLEEKYEKGRVTSYLPSVLGDVEEAVDHDGFSARSEHNDLSQILKAFLPDGTEHVATIYGANNDPLKTTVPAKLDGVNTTPVVTQMVTDGLGNPLATARRGVALDGKVEDVVTVGSHNAHGDPLLEMSPAGYITERTYDERNLCVQVVIDTKGARAKVQRAFDARGFEILQRDPCGWMQAWMHNTSGQLTHHMNAQGLVHSIVYGAGGAVIREEMYEPRGLQNKRLASFDTDVADDHLKPLKAEIKSIAKKMASLTSATAPIVGEIYGRSIFYRDERGRIYWTRRLWTEISGSPKEKYAEFYTWYTNDDLPWSQYVETEDASRKLQKQMIIETEYDMFARRVAMSKGRRLSDKQERVESEPHPRTPHFFPVTRTQGWGYGQCGVSSMSTSNTYVMSWSDPESGQSMTADARRLTLIEHTDHDLGTGILLQRKTNTLAESYKYDQLLRWIELVQDQLATSDRQPFRRLHTTRNFGHEELLRTKSWGKDPVVSRDGSNQDESLTEYVDHCAFGPRKTRVDGTDREFGIEFDLCGRRKRWTQNIVGPATFASQYDGGGNAWSVDAFSGDKLMHKKRFQYDAANRATTAFSEELLHFQQTATGAVAVESYHEPVSDGMTYDTLGNLIKDFQGFNNCFRSFEHTVAPTGQRIKTVYPGTGNKVLFGAAQQEVVDSGITVEYEPDIMNRTKGVWIKESDAGAADASKGQKIVESIGYLSAQNDIMLLEDAPLYCMLNKPRCVDPRKSFPLCATWEVLTRRIIQNPKEIVTYGAVLQEESHSVFPGFATDALINHEREHDRWWGVYKGVTRQRKDITYRRGVHADKNNYGFEVRESSGSIVEVEHGADSKKYQELRRTSSYVINGVLGERTSENTDEVFSGVNGVGNARESVHKVKSTSSSPLPQERVYTHFLIGNGPFETPLTKLEMRSTLLQNSEDKVRQDRDRKTQRMKNVTINGRVNAVDTSVGGSVSQLAYYERGYGFAAEHNAFGQTVRIMDLANPDKNRCDMIYDAQGRLAQKMAPARLVLPEVEDDMIARAKDNAELDQAFNRIATNRFANPGTYTIYLTQDLNVTPSGQPNIWQVFQNFKAAMKKRAQEDQKTSGAAAPYRQLIIDGGGHILNGLSITALPLLEDLGSITFRNLDLRSIDIVNCSNLIFDRCKINGFRARYSAPGLQVQNCVIINAFHLRNLERSTVNIAFNLFKPSQGNAVQLYWIAKDSFDKREEKKAREGKVYVCVHNNVIIDGNGKSGVNNALSITGGTFGHVDFKSYEAFNYMVKRSDFGPNDQKGFNDACAKAERGETFAEQGSADVPSLLEQHSPVLWDTNRVLRDHKHPTPGPIEALKPERHSAFTRRRYFYNGKSLAQRETYRNSKNGEAAKFDDYICDTTRFIPVTSAGAGGTIYCDADGTMDVALNDHYGQPWYQYRAREGARQFKTSDHQKGQNGGQLKGISLPSWKHVGFDPWYMTAVESDILMGRRGVLGWDNVYRNPGLLMHGPLPPVPTFWESVAAAWERNPWKTLGYLAAGLVIVVGGILFTAATFGAGAVGLGSLIVGGAISGFGMSFGITGAITHDLGAATKSGLIGAAAGAIGGAVTFGAMSMVASAAGFGPASAAAINAAMKSGGLGMQAAMGGVGGFAGGAVSGFAGGVMGGLADGKSWGESLNMGLEGAGVGGILGGALGAGLPFIAVGLRGIKNFGKDAISATKAMRSGGQAIGDGEGVIVTTGEQVAHQPAVGFRGWWRNFQVSRAARKMGYYGAARYVEEIGTMPNGQTPLGGMHNPKTGQILLEAKAFDRAFLAKSDLQLHSWRAILAHEIGHSFKGLIPHNTLAPLGSTVGISPRDAKEFWASYFGATVVRNVSKADAASLLRHAYREYR